MVKFGDIVRSIGGGKNRAQGDVFKIIVIEGDGKVGLLRHSLCYKYERGTLSRDYLYEVPWDDMDIITSQWFPEQIKARRGPVEAEIAKHTAQLKALTDLELIHCNKEDESEFLNTFKEALKA